MGCRLAENGPLRALRAELGLAPQCHSLRPACVHDLRRSSAGLALGAAGAVIGYCQALFVRRGSPSDNTRRVSRLLHEIDAPWASSHELFWGQRGPNETPDRFINEAIEPLAGTGRIPILITGLRPSADAATIQEVFSVEPRGIDPSEPILVRLVLADEGDVDAIASQITGELGWAAKHGRMPRWWPLLQSGMPIELWNRLQSALGSAWEFVNIAVNPYTPSAVIREFASQITVAQFPVGAAAGMQGRWVELPSNMAIHGKGEAAGYNFDEYLGQLSQLEVAPTAIVLGPSQPDWSDQVNAERIERFIPYLRVMSEECWGGLSPSAKAKVWRMAA